MIDFAQILELKCLSVGRVSNITSCYIGDILSYALTNLKKDNVWITSQTNINVIAIAYSKEISCIILPDGILMKDDVIKRAEEKGVTVFSSCLSAYDLAIKIGDIISNGGQK